MLIYPIEWHRRINRQWLMRQENAPVQKYFGHLTKKSNSKSGHACSCGEYSAPTAPDKSRFRAPNIIEHDWTCSVCDKRWTTNTRILS